MKFLTPQAPCPRHTLHASNGAPEDDPPNAIAGRESAHLFACTCRPTPRGVSFLLGVHRAPLPVTAEAAAATLQASATVPEFSGPVIRLAQVVRRLRGATGIAHGDTLRDRARAAQEWDPLHVLAPRGKGRPPDGRRGYFLSAVEWVRESYDRAPALARDAAVEVERQAREAIIGANRGSAVRHAVSQLVGPARRRTPKG